MLCYGWFVLIHVHKRWGTGHKLDLNWTAGAENVRWVQSASSPLGEGKGYFEFVCMTYHGGQLQVQTSLKDRCGRFSGRVLADCNPPRLTLRLILKFTQSHNLHIIEFWVFDSFFWQCFYTATLHPLSDWQMLIQWQSCINIYTIIVM